MYGVLSVFFAGLTGLMGHWGLMGRRWGQFCCFFYCFYFGLSVLKFLLWTSAGIKYTRFCKLPVEKMENGVIFSGKRFYFIIYRRISTWVLHVVL